MCWGTAHSGCIPTLILSVCTLSGQHLIWWSTVFWINPSAPRARRVTVYCKWGNITPSSANVTLFLDWQQLHALPSQIFCICWHRWEEGRQHCDAETGMRRQLLSWSRRSGTSRRLRCGPSARRWRTPLDAATEEARASLQYCSLAQGRRLGTWLWAQNCPDSGSGGGGGRWRGTPPVSRRWDCRDNDLNRRYPRAGVGGCAVIANRTRTSAPKVSFVTYVPPVIKVLFRCWCLPWWWWCVVTLALRRLARIAFCSCCSFALKGINGRFGLFMSSGKDARKDNDVGNSHSNPSESGDTCTCLCGLLCYVHAARAAHIDLQRLNSQGFTSVM